MRALVAEGAGKVSLVELPDPVPGPGEAVVRVRAALTCGTDLELLERGHPKVPFPVTLGHEFAGEVESVGEGVPFRPGERVTSTVTAPAVPAPSAGPDARTSVPPPSMPPSSGPTPSGCLSRRGS